MKKITLIILALYLITGKISSQTIVFMSAQCSNTFAASLTASVSGATSYSWTTVPSTVSVYNQGTYGAFGPGSPGIYSVICTPYLGTSPMTAIVSTYTLVSGPVISYTMSAPGTTLAPNSMQVCSGTNVTLTASNATSYTWMPANVTGSSIVVSPSTSSNYYVMANANGTCVSYMYFYVTLVNIPNVSLNITGNNASICGANPVLFATGGTTYTWNTSSNSSSININSLGCYSVASSNACGTSTAQTCFTQSTAVYPLTITSTSSGSMCAGTSATLSVNGPFGANTYSSYSWYGSGLSSGTGTAVVISPNSTSCYTVVGNSNGCSSTAVFCQAVNAPNSFNTYPANNFTACSVPGANLYAYNGGNYLWSGPTGTFNTAGITATVAGCYTVSSSLSTSCPPSTLVVCVNAVTSLPSVTVTTSALNVCAGNSLTFSAVGAATYSWAGYINFNNYVSSNSSSIVITPTAVSQNCMTLTANNGGCVANTAYCYTVNSGISISVSGGTTICSGNSVTLTASGANTYTWANGSNNNSIVVSPSTSSCYVVSGSNACSANLSSSTCINVVSTPTITISGSNTLCTGTSPVYVASGASTYTWISVSSALYLGSGSSMVYTTNIGCFKVYGSNAGCSSVSSTICPTIIQSPTVNIVASNSIVCPGTGVSLYANGAQTYVWSNNTTGSLIIVNPTASSCYTVTGTNAGGCSQTAVVCIIVLPSNGAGNPVNVNVCAGASTILSAGAANSYSWSNGATTGTVLVNPVVNTCYTVTGTNVSGCSSATVHCVNVLSNATLNIAGNNTVCLGTSANLAVTGGLAYNWSTGQTTATINILPTTNTVVSVSSTFTNGCISAAATTITVNNNCSDVWPGDANSDGAVSSSDVLELGLAANATGASRTPGGNSWTAQFANNWSGTVSTGKNKAHADCNGDGTVNSSDTLAIYNNMTMTHSFRPAQPSTDPDLPLVSATNLAFVNEWNSVDIMLGNSTTPSQQIYGVSFDLTFDGSMLYPDSIYLEFNNSTLNTNAPILFRKKDFGGGILYSAIVKTDHADETCGGKIATLKFKISTLADEDADFVIKAINVTAAANGQTTDIEGGEIHLGVSRSVGLKEVQRAAQFSMSPNPANNQLKLFADANELLEYQVTDITGRIVLKGSFSGSTSLDTKTLGAGVYVVCVRNASAQVQKKLVIEK